MVYCFTNDILNYYLELNTEHFTYYFFNLFTFLELCFFTIYFGLSFKSKTSKKILIICFAIFSFYFFYDLIFIEDFAEIFASGPAIFESVFLLTFSIYLLFEQINNTTAIFIYAKKQFWLIVAIICYISGTFFLFIFAQKYLGDPVFNSQYTIMNSILYILKNILISIAFSISESSEAISFKQDSFDNLKKT